ncbi:MAG: hypothetical protein M0R80_31875 [Proteobacteria bacterium]|jgi:hypothetical protein|nr:hypothetical protein [Pseudomonadota bacterium]
MKTKTFAYIDIQDISEELATILYELSPCRNEDGGFSFVVPLYYLLSYKGDVETDMAGDASYAPKQWEQINGIIRAMQEDGMDALFLCNEDHMRIKD